MSGITLTIREEGFSEALAAVDRLYGVAKSDELKEQMGLALRLTLINHFAALEGNPFYHKTAYGLGASPTGFFADAARETQAPEVEGDGVSVSITKRGLRQRFFGGTIRPTLKKWLTIPAIAEAYGKAAGSFFNLRFVPLGPDLAALVERRATLIKRKRGKGASGFQPVAETIGAVFFWLKKQVTQHADPGVLPTNEEMIAAALERGQQSLTTIWERAAA